MYYNPYGLQQQVIRVNGENGAMALNLAPNSSALVLDETAPIVWLCRTDGAGYKTCTPFPITEPKQVHTPTVQELVERIDKLEARINEPNTKRAKSAERSADKSEPES